MVTPSTLVELTLENKATDRLQLENELKEHS